MIFQLCVPSSQPPTLNRATVLHSPETSSSPEHLLWYAGKKLSLELFFLPGSPWPRRNSRNAQPGREPLDPIPAWGRMSLHQERGATAESLQYFRNHQAEGIGKNNSAAERKSPSCLTSFLLPFKNIALKAPQSSQSQAVWHQKGALMRKSTTRDDQNAFIQVYTTNPCFIPCPGRQRAALSVPGSAAPRISAPASSCRLHSPSSWLELPAMRLHQESSLTQEFFWLNLTSRLTLEGVKAKEGRKKNTGKQKAPQLPEFPHNGIIIYSVQTPLLQFRVTLWWSCNKSPRTLSSLSCCSIYILASLPCNVWNFLHNQITVKLGSRI